MNLENYKAKNFNRGKSLATEVAWRLVSALVFQSSSVPFYGLKRSILRLFGARIGRGVLIKPRVTITFPWKLSVGGFCWLGEGVWIDNLAEVTIENHSVISQGSYLCTGNHNFRSESFELIAKPIHIASRVWVGAQCTIGPGVVIREGCVISLSSVVLKDCEPQSIYQGNPAQYVGRR